MKFVFTTQEDNRVCPECALLAGLIYDPDEDVPDIPVHSNCRCRYILYNEADSPILPFMPITLLNLRICPEGYIWDDEELGCVPIEEEL